MNPLRRMGNPLNQGINNNQPQIPMGAGAPTGQINQPQPNNQMSPMQRMIFTTLYNRNPKIPNSNLTFRDLMNSVQGQTPEQAFQNYGLDYNNCQNIGVNQIKNMLGL